MKLGGDQKEKMRTYGAQCQDQEAKTATWNVLGSVLSIATEKMLSSASLFLLIYCTISALLRLGETAVVPPEATAIVQTSKMELNTHCSKIVRRVMEKTVALAKGLVGWHLNTTKIHQAMPTGKGESNLFAHWIIRIAQIRGGILFC